MGEGLGKTSSGIKTNIQIHKKQNPSGVGHTEVNNFNDTWWSNNIQDTLNRLSSSSKNKKKKSKKNTSDSKIMNTIEDDIFNATGGMQIGMRRMVRKRSTTTITKIKDNNEDKFEWNGLDDAKIILSSKNDDKKIKKRKMDHHITNDNASSSTNSQKEEKKRKKKKRKRKDDDNCIEKDKKSKKGKKKKKKS